ncbi:hypothetical protein CSE15_16320 [Bacillus altitudinis]|nr:hypothetical protein CSE15_16320 [Bacillus altitudinis]
MITLCVIAYVVISTILSIADMRDRYVLGGWVWGSPPKKAFILGFSIIPIFLLIFGLAVGVFYAAGCALVGIFYGGEWVFINMP